MMVLFFYTKKISNLLALFCTSNHTFTKVPNANTFVSPEDQAYFVNAVVKKGQAGVLVADEGALLDEANEHLGFGQHCVELLVGAVAALQEP